MNFRFTKAERLTKRKEFERVFQAGKVFKNEKIVLYVLLNELSHSRIGLVVSKKVGNAVRRNRAKRLLREVYRLNKNLFRVSVDIIAIPRKVFSYNLSLNDIEEGFKTLIHQINKNYRQ